MALAQRQAAVVHPTLLAVLATTIAVVPALTETIGALPIVPLLLPLLISAIAIRGIPWAQATRSVWRAGRLDAVSWSLSVATSVASAGALLLWAVWTDNLGMGARMMQSAAQAPILPLVLLGIPAFGVANAATEEAIYRGVLQEALGCDVPVARVCGHDSGALLCRLALPVWFPQRPRRLRDGCGGALGYLRHRTRGLAAPFLAHVAADLVIAYVLLESVLWTRRLRQIGHLAGRTGELEFVVW